MAPAAAAAVCNARIAAINIGVRRIEGASLATRELNLALLLRLRR